MRLRWTRRAHADRRAVREHIAVDNPLAAVAMDTLFSEKTARLIDHPGMGRAGTISGTRELVIHPNYMLVYDLHGDMIRILRLLHTARRWPEGN